MTAETWALIVRQLRAPEADLILTTSEAAELFTLTRGSPFAALSVGPGDVRLMSAIRIAILPDLTTTNT